MATAKQINFIGTLVTEQADIYRGAGMDAVADAVTAWFATYDANECLPTIGKASEAINKLISKNKELKAQLRRVPATSAASGKVTEDGMYKVGDTIYKVQYAKNGSGNLYAKELMVHGEGHDAEVWFEYVPGAINKIRAEHKLSLEDAKAFGVLYGNCCVCGRDLTDEKSIEAGIGPICAGKF